MTTSAHPFPLPSVRFLWAFRSGSVAFPCASAFFPLGLRFLSSASASVPVTQLTVLPFSSLPGSPHSGSPVLRVFFRCHGLSPFRLGWFPIRASGFCLLSFLFVSFRPSLLRSRSRFTGARPSLSLRRLPWRSLSFVRSRFRLLTTQPLFLPFLSLPASASQWLPRCTPVPFVPAVLPPFHPAGFPSVCSGF